MSPNQNTRITPETANSILLSEHKYPVNLCMCSAAVQSTVQTAMLLGMDKASSYHLEMAMEEAFINAVEHYSTQPDQEDYIYISFRIEHEELVISIREKGIPFSLKEAQVYSPDEPDKFNQKGLGTFLMHSVMDKVELFVHGQEGKELRLHKKFDVEKANPQLFELYNTTQNKTRRQNALNPVISIATPDDVPDIMKLAWRCYNYSHISLLYNEEEMRQKIIDGEIVSFIVRGESSSDIIYHAALHYWERSPGVPEAGLAFADPNWRVGGVTEMMGKMLHSYSREHGDRGLYDYCVTTHIYSQKGSQEYGPRPCVIQFALAPSSTAAKVPGMSTQNKGTTLSHYFAYDLSNHTIYLPQKHHAIARDIYGWLNLPRNFAQSPATITGTESKVIHFADEGELNCAFITVLKIGEDTIREIREYRKKALHKKMDSTYVSIPLGNENAAALCEQCEAEGYSFAGIMPHVHNGDDQLILQQVNISVERESIRIFGEAGNRLMDYVWNEYHRQSK